MIVQRTPGIFPGVNIRYSTGKKKLTARPLAACSWRRVKCPFFIAERIAVPTTYYGSFDVAFPAPGMLNILKS